MKTEEEIKTKLKEIYISSPTSRNWAYCGGWKMALEWVLEINKDTSLDQRQIMLELKKDFDKPIPDELVEELDLFSKEWAASSYQDMCFGHSSTRRQGETWN